MRRTLVGFVIIATMICAWWFWLKAQPVQPLPVSCRIASHLPEGEFVSEPTCQIKRLAFVDLDGDGFRDKVVVDEKCVSPFKMKALLRIYWGDGRGRETLGEVAYLWSVFGREPTMVFLADLDGDGQKEILSFVGAFNHRLVLAAWKYDRQRKKAYKVGQLIVDAPFNPERMFVLDLGRDEREEIVTSTLGVERMLGGFREREVVTVWVFGWDEQKVWWRKKATFRSKAQITFSSLSVPVMRMAPQLTAMHLKAPQADFFAIPFVVEKARWDWLGFFFFPYWQYFTLLLQADSPDPSRWRLVTEVKGKPLKVADLDGDGIKELIARDEGILSLVRVSRRKVEVAVLKGKGEPKVFLPHQLDKRVFVQWSNLLQEVTLNER